MSVLDISNHDYSTFDAKCLKRQGVERVVIGCWIKAQTKDMALQCRAAGIAVEDFYTFVYYRLGHERWEVNNALSLAKEIGGIKRIWIDCEATWTAHTGDLDTEAAGTTPAQRISITAGVVGQISAAGIEPCIYTSSWWWPEKMANSQAFSSLKLWHSAYGANDPDDPRTPITTVGYGGWTDVSAHQFSSTIPVCGRGRDHNYWYLEEDDMAENDRQRLDALERALTGLAGDAAEMRLSQWNQKGAEWSGNSLLDGYIAEQQKLATHTENHPGGSEVGPHIHVPGDVVQTP